VKTHVALLSWLLLAGCTCSGSGPTAGGATPYVRCAMRDAPSIDTTVGPLHLHASERVLVIDGATAPVVVAAFRGPALAEEPIEPALDAIEGASLAIVIGSLGDDEAHVETLLRALGSLTIPTLVVMGGRDHPADLAAALAALDEDARGRIVDASGLRSVQIAGIELVPVAGAPDGRYARDDDACGLGAADVDAIANDLGTAAALPRFLITYAAPTPTLGMEGAEAGSALVADLATRIGAHGAVFAWPDVASPGASFVVPPLAGPPTLLADGARLEPGVLRLSAQVGAVGLSLVP
jgi:hypothetical protein